ncbi:MAG: hypothetical protein PHZ26_01360 [Candidatus Gracilibacteria bacterium]|nr:hypothetical protein [Candidatus Gracilibacteria bacterium]MDD2908383.1 hypothetical protein [Candidatus Gracilibacteria bacterium]
MLYFINSNEILNSLPLEELLKSIFLEYIKIIEVYLNEILPNVDLETKEDIKNGLIELNNSIMKGEVDNNEELLIINQTNNMINYFLSSKNNLEKLAKNKIYEKHEKYNEIDQNIFNGLFL